MSLKSVTISRSELFPEILSPEFRIFFSPITVMFAFDSSFWVKSFDISSGPIPDGSPSNKAIFFFLFVIFFLTVSNRL